MKLRPWMWVVGGIPAAITLLIVTESITSTHKNRVRIAQAQAGQTDKQGGFGPMEIYASQSLFSGLMESLQPINASRASLKTVGLDLSEVTENPVNKLPHAGSASLKLIRTGRVSLEVTEFEKAAKELGKMVEALGGYLADTQIHLNPSGSRSGSITLKVPAASFESVGSKIRSLGKVMSESSNVQDVTKAYSDLETRLRVKREALNRVRELLRMRAGNLKEVLEAEKEISRITEEIEQAEGERRFFDHQIFLSTISVELNEPEPISLARPSSWWALSEALRDSAAMIAGSLAFMLRLLLILLPWAAAVWGVLSAIRWIRVRRNRNISNIETKLSSSAMPNDAKQ